VTGGSFLFSDGQVHHDTHAVPMGNNVTRRLGNYVLTSRPCLGNYVIADMIGGQRIQVGLPHAGKTVEITAQADTYQITVEDGIHHHRGLQDQPRHQAA
jgi:hypothetical protein